MHIEAAPAVHPGGAGWGSRVQQGFRLAVSW